MQKKATVKDVAREAGVSVATVSYIMNNRQDVKISEQTRKKVLQVANLLDYTPSFAAKSLATGRNNIIGVSYSLTGHSPSRDLALHSFINQLIEQLNRMKYDVLFIPVSPVADNSPITRNIDGIIAIDLTDEDFRKMADSYMVPIIAVDMLVNDDLFYQVCTNIPVLLQKLFAKYPDAIFVTEKYSNEAFMEFLTKDIPSQCLFVYSPDMAHTLPTILHNRKVIVLGAYLSLLLLPYSTPENMISLVSDSHKDMLPNVSEIIDIEADKKASLSINLLLNALDRKFDINHKHLLDI